MAAVLLPWGSGLQYSVSQDTENTFVHGTNTFLQDFPIFPAFRRFPADSVPVSRQLPPIRSPSSALRSFPSARFSTRDT